MLQDQDLLSVQEVRTKVEKAYHAWQKYLAYSQEQIDSIVERMAAAARAHSKRLAELSVCCRTSICARAYPFRQPIARRSR